MSGKRRSWNQVNEEKTMAGVSWCPVLAYTMKATTDAIAGIHMATAMLAARINNIVRTWLRKTVSYDLRLKRNEYDAKFTSSQVP